MKLIRDKCVVCDSENLNVFLRYEMPVYNSDISTKENHQTSDISFSECLKCNSVQLKEFVDTETVYQFNHNREIIGQTWEKHYDEFKEFISDIKGKTILEISDPSAKLAKKFDNYRKWYIVEPHSSGSIDDKIIFIDKFFDSEFEIQEKIDIIIHSHFFEHTFKPLEFLNKCNELLEDGGVMFISTPNLHSILHSRCNPNNVLHFEHTFYFDKDILNYLAINSGFELKRIYEFKNHSLFLELKKVKKQNLTNVPKFEKSSNLFVASYNFYKKLIDLINSTNCKYVLFGCHVSSQFLIYNGLDTSKISFIIDNSIHKQDKYLYGTNIISYSPKKILENDDVVIVSHMGVYAEEIKEGLLKIKKNIKFI